MKKVFNYKLQAKNPTKQEENDYIEMCKLQGKKYAYKPLKETEGLYGEYSFDKVVEYKWWERLLIRAGIIKVKPYM